jgi:hypothetical protein
LDAHRGREDFEEKLLYSQLPQADQLSAIGQMPWATPLPRSTVMDILQELHEIEALKRLKGRYCLLMDTKQWDAGLDLFLPDATLKWDTAVATRGRDGQTSDAYAGAGVDQIRKHVVEQVLDPADTVHQGHTPVIDFTSDTTANAIWAMEGLARYPDGSGIQAFGHYYETYEKVEGSWKIASLHLTRLWLNDLLHG